MFLQFLCRSWNTFGQEIGPLIAIKIFHSVLWGFLLYIMFAYRNLICVKFPSFICFTPVFLLVLFADFTRNADLHASWFFLMTQPKSLPFLFPPSPSLPVPSFCLVLPSVCLAFPLKCRWFRIIASIWANLLLFDLTRNTYRLWGQLYFGRMTFSEVYILFPSLKSSVLRDSVRFWQRWAMSHQLNYQKSIFPSI